MTLAMILLAALTLGAMVPGRRLLVAPALIGGFALLVLAVSGRQVSDTPIPFLIVMATAAMLAGGWFRSRWHPGAPEGRRNP